MHVESKVTEKLDCIMSQLDELLECVPDKQIPDPPKGPKPMPLQAQDQNRILQHYFPNARQDEDDIKSLYGACLKYLAMLDEDEKKTKQNTKVVTKAARVMARKTHLPPKPSPLKREMSAPEPALVIDCSNALLGTVKARKKSSEFSKDTRSFVNQMHLTQLEASLSQPEPEKHKMVNSQTINANKLVTFFKTFMKSNRVNAMKQLATTAHMERINEFETPVPVNAMMSRNSRPFIAIK